MIDRDQFLVAMDYLNKDPVHHMDMLQPIHRGTAEILAANAHGVLLREKVSQAHLLTARTLQDVMRFMERISESRLLAGEMFGAFMGRELAGFIGLHEGLEKERPI